jgi:RHS repeat-associated protein
VKLVKSSDQRYYASTYGNFTSPDPSMENVDYKNPLSWNAYAYVNGDPVNSIDPFGLMTCGDKEGYDIYSGLDVNQTFSQLLANGSDLALFGTTIFVESAESVSQNGQNEIAAIGAVIFNRFQLVNGYAALPRSNGTYQNWPAAWGTANNTFKSIVVNPKQFEVWQGAGGTLTTAAQSRLDQALASNVSSSLCQALTNAYTDAIYYIVNAGQPNLLVEDSATGLFYTGFNSFPGTQKYDWEQYIGQFGSANKFYGVPDPIPVGIVRRPPSRPKRPGGGLPR